MLHRPVTVSPAKAEEKKETPVSSYQIVPLPAEFNLQANDIISVTPSLLAYESRSAIKLLNKETKQEDLILAPPNTKIIALPGDRLATIYADQIDIYNPESKELLHSIPFTYQINEKPRSNRKIKLSLDGQYLTLHLTLTNNTDYLVILNTGTLATCELSIPQTLSDVAITSSDTLVVALDTGGIQVSPLDFTTQIYKPCSEILAPEEIFTHLWTGWDHPSLVTTSLAKDADIEDLTLLKLWTLNKTEQTFALNFKQNIGKIEDFDSNRCAALVNSMLFFDLKSATACEFRFDTLSKQDILIKGYNLWNICSISPESHVLFSAVFDQNVTFICADMSSVISYQKKKYQEYSAALTETIEDKLLPPLRTLVLSYLHPGIRFFASANMSATKMITEVNPVAPPRLNNRTTQARE